MSGWIARCWRDYELPADRAAESFTFKLEELDYDNVTDTIYTDEPAEVARITAAMVNQGYGSRVTNQTTGESYRQG